MFAPAGRWQPSPRGCDVHRPGSCYKLRDMVSHAPATWLDMFWLDSLPPNALTLRFPWELEAGSARRTLGAGPVRNALAAYP